jgi:dTDP-4-dehydrorhamnose 3,5-epimerase-like enzyme
MIFHPIGKLIEFGQTYMTTMYPGVAKAWHDHYQQPDEYRLDPHDNHIPYKWARRDG